MTLLQESRELHREMHELDELSRRVVLAPPAKRRLEELPGEIAALHARIDAETEQQQADEEAIRAAYTHAQDFYIQKIEELLEAKEKLDAITASAKSQGVYPGIPLGVRASNDRALFKFLTTARATAFA